MSQRPLVFVLGLTLGDLLLWNWSLNHNHDVLALVSGLTLPPLALASLWMLAISLARLLAFIARRRPSRSQRLAASKRLRRRRTAAARAAATTGGAPQGSPVGETPSRKIAA